VSKRIIKIRGNLDRETFGAKIGVSGRTVQRWELNNELPKGKETVKIAEEFGVNAHWLLTGQGEPYITNDGEKAGAGRERTFPEPPGGTYERAVLEAEGLEGGDPAAIARIIEMLMKIVGSGNRTLNRAIFSGLEAFSESVSLKNHIDELEAKIHSLMENVERIEEENQTLRVELNRMKALYENPGTAPDAEEEAV